MHFNSQHKIAQNVTLKHVIFIQQYKWLMLSTNFLTESWFVELLPPHCDCFHKPRVNINCGGYLSIHIGFEEHLHYCFVNHQQTFRDSCVPQHHQVFWPYSQHTLCWGMPDTGWVWQSLSSVAKLGSFLKKKKKKDSFSFRKFVDIQVLISARQDMI